MMGYPVWAMMGAGPFGLMVFLTWLVALIAGVLLIMFLWQKISRK